MVDLFDKNILETINENTSSETGKAFTESASPTHLSFNEIKKQLKHNVSDEIVEKRLSKLEEAGFLTSKEEKWRLTFKGKMILEDFWNTLSELKIVEEVEETTPETIEKHVKETEKIKPLKKEVKPKKLDKKIESPPLSSPELSRTLEDLGSKRKQAIEFLKELSRSYEAGLIDDELYDSFREQFSEKLEEMEYEIEEKIQLSKEAQLEQVEAIKEDFEKMPMPGDESGVKTGTLGRLGIIFSKASSLYILTGTFFLFTGYILIAELFFETSIMFFGLNAWILTFSITIVLAVITGINISLRRSKNEDLLE